MDLERPGFAFVGSAANSSAAQEQAALSQLLLSQQLPDACSNYPDTQTAQQLVDAFSQQPLGTDVYQFSQETGLDLGGFLPFQPTSRGQMPAARPALSAAAPLLGQPPSNFGLPPITNQELPAPAMLLGQLPETVQTLVPQLHREQEGGSLQPSLSQRPPQQGPKLTRPRRAAPVVAWVNHLLQDLHHGTCRRNSGRLATGATSTGTLSQSACVISRTRCALGMRMRPSSGS